MTGPVNRTHNQQNQQFKRSLDVVRTVHIGQLSFSFLPNEVRPVVRDAQAMHKIRQFKSSLCLNALSAGLSSMSKKTIFFNFRDFALSTTHMNCQLISRALILKIKKYKRL
jgi:hypothetical protein